MSKLRTGIIGMGYIGESHIDAVRRIGATTLYAVADTNAALARAKADAFGVEKCYSTVDELLADPNVDVVHDCTPNNLHTDINIRAIRAGKHLLSEKPLAQSYAEALRLIEAARERPDVRVGVNFNYRMNPMVQEMRARVKSGEVGDIYLATGCYLQDWLLYDTDYSWRLEPEIAGESCCVADIGSHWMDLVQHVTGLRITEVMADLRTTMPVRKKPLRQTETFSTGAKVAYEPKTVKNEDCANVLFRLSNGGRGAFTVSEVSAGHGCYFQVELSGANESLMWNQERNDRLWIGRRGGENSELIRDPSCMDPRARAHTALAKGHPEGWNDAFKGNIEAFYRTVLGAEDEGIATLEEAARVVRLTEACVRSSRERRWITIDD